MFKLSFRLMLPAVVLGGLAVSAHAQDKPKLRPPADRTYHLYKASELMGKNVTNPKGENIGEIKDIVIDVDRGRIAYAVLDFGGFLGIGDKYFAIPWSSLGLTDDGKKFTLDADKNRLKNAPGFDKKNWPNMAERQWNVDVYKYYGQPPYWEKHVRVKMTATIEPEAAFHIQKASDLIGKKVYDPKNEKLAEVNNLVVDFERGYVPYAIVEFGGFLGFKEKLSAVPWHALKLVNGDKQFQLDMDKERLKNAPSFEKRTWPDFNNPQWARDVHAFYNQEPYWND